jgi:hypothetical protein
MLLVDLSFPTYAAATYLFPSDMAHSGLGTYAGRFSSLSVPDCLLHPVLAKAPQYAERRPGSNITADRTTRTTFTTASRHCDAGGAGEAR